MPNIISTPKEWRETRKKIKGSLGFVPTMGALHSGHAGLARRARAENDAVVVSIFVNPTQFNQAADFEKYQRTLEADQKLLKAEGVDYIFHPDAKDMYADDYSVRVSETGISEVLEGQFRPGHFGGMMTVVLKLLNIIQADRAYFGEKDFQQLALVRKMVDALFVPTEIIPCATARGEDGLALSSRNARLSDAERKKATEIYRVLTSKMSDEQAMKALADAGFKPEYVSTRWGRRLAAAWLGDVRLIDNIAVGE